MHPAGFAVYIIEIPIEDKIQSIGTTIDIRAGFKTGRQFPNPYMVFYFQRFLIPCLLCLFVQNREFLFPDYFSKGIEENSGQFFGYGKPLLIDKNTSNRVAVPMTPGRGDPIKQHLADVLKGHALKRFVKFGMVSIPGIMEQDGLFDLFFAGIICFTPVCRL